MSVTDVEATFNTLAVVFFAADATHLARVSFRDFFNRYSFHCGLVREDVGEAVERPAMEINGQEVYVWVAVDVETFEILYVDVSAGQSSLDALLLLREVLPYCRGRPVILADHGQWTTGRLPSSSVIVGAKHGENGRLSKHGSAY